MYEITDESLNDEITKAHLKTDKILLYKEMEHQKARAEFHRKNMMYHLKFNNTKKTWKH